MCSARGLGCFRKACYTEEDFDKFGMCSEGLPNYAAHYTHEYGMKVSRASCPMRDHSKPYRIMQIPSPSLINRESRGITYRACTKCRLVPPQHPSP